MDAAEFRKHGYRMVDWIADYWEKVEDRRILPDVKPGEIRSRMPQAAPEAPEPFDDIMADLDEIVMPGITHWQSPGWFAFFPANSSPPAVLGELAAAGLGVQGMLWATSPACTEVESQVMDWMVDLMGLPQEWKTTGPGGGVIQGSASEATHMAVVIARHVKSSQVTADDMVAYTSAQAHSSVEKGARVAGIGHLRLVETDANLAMSPAALSHAVAADRAGGLTPAFVGSTVGTTGTTAVDPLRAIGEIAGSEGMWHHVDAAFSGTAMICEEFRHYQDGLELVDSYVFNPHKWMLTNFDCSAMYLADRRPMIDALSITPPYLRNQATEGGEVIDYRDWQVPLGRRFRALKLWFVLRSYGAEGIRAKVREDVRLARWLTERVEAHPLLELVAPTTFSLVSFRHTGSDEETSRIAEGINSSGWAYVTASILDDRPLVRVSIGQTNTEARHVRRLWELIKQLTEEKT
ncbi:MAG: pyridoxal-dependent decarboxylase [bacterium]|nr:aspartate aminotransferase family protein [Acidimicrobiia bacterium]MCY4651216.1 pyridoxal-dependent decarboxylase [bacterium]